MPPRRKVLPKPLPDGLIVKDNEKKDWRLGKIIGKGGFGLIYLASKRLDVPVPDDTNFVIKVEFYENGPLFTELKFYQRAAKQESLHKWIKAQKLDFLGIPTYWGSGQFEHQGERYRFMVMDRLGCDLNKVCQENGGRLKKQTVLKLGYHLLHVLEYIHSSEYVHADIKAANLLLGCHDASKVYLADYGLSYRFCPDGIHKEYKENPKKSHNGTIEYTSSDAHKGVAPSRRGDLETLGYCLVHWMCGRLPWDSVLKSPQVVQEAKARLMDNLPESVLELSDPDSETEAVANFMLYVKTLEYKDKPDYQMLRDILASGLKRPDDPLDFSKSVAEAARGRSPKAVREASKPRAEVLGRKKLAAYNRTQEAPEGPQPQRRPRAAPRPSYQKAQLTPLPSKAEKAVEINCKAGWAGPEPVRDACSLQWTEGSEEEEEHLDDAPLEPKHGLRETPARRRDLTWVLKLYSSIVTVLALTLLALLAL